MAVNPFFNYSLDLHFLHLNEIKEKEPENILSSPIIFEGVLTSFYIGY